jgi:hypothetical protein
MAEAVAHHHGEEGGVLAQTPLTRRRPGTFSHGSASSVTFSGTASRAIVVPSSSQAQRRQKHRERELQASDTTVEATVREAARQE